MKIIKPVEITSHGFAFCRWGVAALVWLALIPGWWGLLWIASAILTASAVLKVQNAPMVWLHRVTLGRLIPSPTVMLDEYAMAFAHRLGACMTLACCAAWLWAPMPFAVAATLLMGIAKAAGALGYCSGVRLYECMNNQNCCRFMRTPDA